MGAKKNATVTASDRTIDMYTGSTNLEASEQSDAKETAKSSETIEQMADRKRASMVFTAEHLSKHWNKNLPSTEKFRLTTKDGLMFLEKLELGSKGEAYAWSGVMFREESLYELTSVFVKASKDRQSTERI